jgi:hypothetical protein
MLDSLVPACWRRLTGLTQHAQPTVPAAGAVGSVMPDSIETARWRCWLSFPQADSTVPDADEMPTHSCSIQCLHAGEARPDHAATRWRCLLRSLCPRALHGCMSGWQGGIVVAYGHWRCRLHAGVHEPDVRALVLQSVQCAEADRCAT